MKALLVIDMLRDFIDRSGTLYVGQMGETIVPFINEKIREYRKDNAPIIFICDNHEEDDKEFEMFNSHCVAGSPGSEIIKQIDVRDGDKIIRKRRYSAFCGTELDIFFKGKADRRDFYCRCMHQHLCTLHCCRC